MLPDDVRKGYLLPDGLSVSIHRHRMATIDSFITHVSVNLHVGRAQGAVKAQA
jgi:hypothetical protein